MKVVIKYITQKTRREGTKVLLRDSVNEALRFFQWRYGHEIISVDGILSPAERQSDCVPYYSQRSDPMVAGENCGAFMANGDPMV